jgi:SNF family Na+-dependent transporter
VVLPATTPAFEWPLTPPAGVLGRGNTFGYSAAARGGVAFLLRFVLFIPITVVALLYLLVHYGGWSASREARATAVA